MTRLSNTPREAVPATVRPFPDRVWRGGPIRLIAFADGHCMVRRPGAGVFVLTAKEWAALPETPA